jgi:hypothetical protein
VLWKTARQKIGWKADAIVRGKLTASLLADGHWEGRIRL